MSATGCIPSSQGNHDVELSQLSQHGRNGTADRFGQDRDLDNREQRKTSSNLSNLHEYDLNNIHNEVYIYYLRSYG